VPAIKIGHRLVPGESARIGYQINPDALASFSVENLFNQQYSRYLDVAPSPGHGLAPLPFLSARQLASWSVCAKLVSRGKRQE
jgi:hypothetical protein